MSFDKNYPKRKDWRKPLRRSKRFDRSCRNHGGCPWCEGNRTHINDARELGADEQIEDFLKKDDEKFGDSEKNV